MVRGACSILRCAARWDVRHYQTGRVGLTLCGMSNLPVQGRVRPRPWTQGLLTVLIAATAVYLISNHWLHALDALPYLGVVLVKSLCMFGHVGHGGHGGHGSSTHQGNGGQEAPGGPARPGPGGGGGHVH